MRRLLILLWLIPLTACATSGPRGQSGCAWQVCVSFVDGPLGRDYRATNREPVPVTISMEFDALENLLPPPGGRVDVVVPPETTAAVAYLAAIDSDRPVGASVKIQIDLGSSTNQNDPEFVYDVPFGGSMARELVQGFDGTETHMGSMRYSLDFKMPIGTPILAAREGTVLLVQDGFTEGGTDPELLERANLVVVAHSDGSMASYGHLRPGIQVRPGEHVWAGDLLGYSGATGFAGQPHLHFHVGNRMLGEPGRTIPIQMKDRQGQPISLEMGTWVQPARRRMAR